MLVTIYPYKPSRTLAETVTTTKFYYKVTSLEIYKCFLTSEPITGEYQKFSLQPKFLVLCAELREEPVKDHIQGVQR